MSSQWLAKDVSSVCECVCVSVFIGLSQLIRMKKKLHKKGSEIVILIRLNDCGWQTSYPNTSPPIFSLCSEFSIVLIRRLWR